MSRPDARWAEDVIVPRAVLRAPEAFGGTPEGDGLRGRAVVSDDRIVRLDPAPATDTPIIVIPKLIEAHCHLDKCHTIHRMGTVGGDLAAAISAQTLDKSLWTAEDLRTRMTRGLAEAKASGCGALRTHIDWADDAAPPLAWDVVRDVASDETDIMVQAAALTGIDQMADPRFCDQVARHVADAGAVLGSFILYHEHVKTGLRHVFAAAERYGLALDFHVDEGHGDYNGLETIADVALDMGFQGPVLCGHAVSLMDRSEADVQRIADKLRRAGVAVCALPTTNLYLQGRTPGTPDRRGITRLRELRAAGVPIVVGSDNVGDAFCPFGAHDPMASLHLASLAGHLDPPMGHWLPCITTDAAEALGLPKPCVDDAPIDSLLAADTADLADLISGRAARRALKDISKDADT